MDEVSLKLSLKTGLHGRDGYALYLLLLSDPVSRLPD